MADPKITDIVTSEGFLLNTSNLPVKSYRLDFKLEDHGSYYVELPQEGYTVEKGKQKILDKVKEITSNKNMFG